MIPRSVLLLPEDSYWEVNVSGRRGALVLQPSPCKAEWVTFPLNVTDV